MSNSDSESTRSVTTRRSKHIRLLSLASAILLIAAASFFFFCTACSKEETTAKTYYTEDGIAYTYDVIYFDDDPDYKYPDYVYLRSPNYTTQYYTYNLTPDIFFVGNLYGLYNYESASERSNSSISLTLSHDSYVYFYVEGAFNNFNGCLNIMSGWNVDYDENNILEFITCGDHEGYCSVFLPAGDYTVWSGATSTNLLHYFIVVSLV